MKAAMTCATVCGAAFLLAGIQLGLFDGTYAKPSGETVSVETVKKNEVRAKFPQDLAPAARAQPVPKAAKYDPEAESDIRLIFLKTSGAVHPWQEYLNDDWVAERVEHTQLAVVLGSQKKSHIETHTYPNGAPPVSRYRYELEASVVEAQTGKVLGNRVFVNMPRGIKPLEAWELTAIGQPVSFSTVFRWVSSNAKTGFPPEDDPKPLINVVD